MNYRITICGHRFKSYDECVKLIIHSARESDYITSVKGKSGSTPFSPRFINLILTGSSKKTFNNIILDFDGMFKKSSEGILLNPEILGINPSPSAFHYWGMLGALCKVVGDISPAYVTGYLLEKGMKKELESFSEFSARLPFALQVAVNESFKDN